MDAIVWKDDYLVGVREIDRQHQDLVKLINRLLIIHRTGDAPSLVKRLLMEIVKFAEYHFISEENIMIITRYPGFEQQRAEHDRIIGELQARTAAYLEGQESVDGLLTYLVTWFVGHTVHEDKRIGVHVNNGVSDDTTIHALTGNR